MFSTLYFPNFLRKRTRWFLSGPFCCAIVLIYSKWYSFLSVFIISAASSEASLKLVLTGKSGDLDHQNPVKADH